SPGNKKSRPDLCASGDGALQRDDRRQKTVHVARAKNSIGDHDGKKNLGGSLRKAEMDVHVPEAGNEILPATIDDRRAARNSNPTVLVHRGDGSSADLDSHVG